ncbi:MAG TPA: hypothetical protein VNH18_22815 [Bryobacteraceae bacterium]|nr:hypothetical protein [Bryobacteraceae bacterium]
MAFGGFGKVLADQAIEATKKNVLGTLAGPEAPKPAPAPAAAPLPDAIGAIILGQIQGMQKALKEDQELLVQYFTGVEIVRVLEIFVPNIQVFVLSGTDVAQNPVRIVVPATAAALITRVTKSDPASGPVRVNVLSPRPKPE